MNIYIHVEISARELDSKLLLATIAASKGHQVVISDLSSINSGINNGLLAPGVFHTKSLTPTQKKIERHENYLKKNFIITSIDEEAGLDIDGYDEFSNTRYSDVTINQSSSVFAWGNEDEKTLKSKYPKHSSKIVKTGSPRADLWKPLFSNYWKNFDKKPEKPFLLISSNLTFANNMQPLHETIESQARAGYYERYPWLLKYHFGVSAEHHLTTYEFIKAIKYLSKHSNGYDIVLRPHPIEDINTWKIYLEGVPNVHVIREDSISAWVNSAFAVMHNGCTTAFEATISQKPVLTYDPYTQKYGNEPPNKLGCRVETLEQLLSEVKNIYNNLKVNKKNDTHETVDKTVFEKIFVDENELAAEKIIKVWERFDNKNFSQNNNWIKFQSFLKYKKFRETAAKLFKKLFPSIFGKNKKSYKFQLLNEHDISKRINKLKDILQIDKKLVCKLLSDRTILIKKL